MRFLTPLRFLTPGIAAVCLLALSCATVPPPADQAAWLDVLPPDSAMFAAVNVSGARSLLEGLAAQGGLEDRQVREVLERTERAYFGVTPTPGGPARFSLVAVGAFSPAALELRLSFDRLWAKRTLGDRGEDPVGALRTASIRPAEPGPCAGGPGEQQRRPLPWQPARTYWEHPELPYQLASPRAGVILLSNESVAGLLVRLEGSPGALLPRDARLDLEQADLFLFFPELPAAEGTEGLTLLPIRSVWLAAKADAVDYRISAVFTLEGGVSQGAVERLFRLLIPLLLRRARVEDPIGKLRALTLSVDPTRVRIDNLPLAAGELSRFLADFVPEEGGSGAGGR